MLAYPQMIMIDAAGEETDTREHSLELDDARPSARFAKFTVSVRRRVDVRSGVRPLPNVGVPRNGNLLGAYIAADMILLGEIALRGRIVEIPEYLVLRTVP